MQPTLPFKSADFYFLDPYAVKELDLLQLGRPGTYVVSHYFESLVDMLAVNKGATKSLKRVFPDSESVDTRKFSKEASTCPPKTKAMMALAHLDSILVALRLDGDSDEPLVNLMALVAAECDSHWDVYFGGLLAFEGKGEGSMRNVTAFHSVGVVLAMLRRGLSQGYTWSPSEVGEARILDTPIARMEPQGEAGEAGVAKAIRFDFALCPGACVVKLEPSLLVELVLRITQSVRAAHFARKLQTGPAFDKHSPTNANLFSLKVV